MSSLLQYHPSILWPLQCLAIASASFTQPSSSVRYGAVFLSAVLTWSFSTTSHDYMENAVHKQMLETLHTTYTWLAVERLLISRWTYEARGPERYRTKDGKEVDFTTAAAKRRSKPDSLWERMVFSTNLLFSPRGIGEPWEVKNVPSFSSSDPGYVPAKAAFLLRWLASTTILFLIVDFAGAAPPPEPGMFPSQQISLLRRIRDVSSQELVNRAIGTFSYWINVFCITTIFADVAGLSGVGTGLSSPKSWRPTYGPVSKTCTIRGLWGVFWHQNIRMTFEGVSTFMTRDVLKLRKGSVINRYMNIFLTFLVSGFIHLGSDFARGISFRESGAIQFWCMQAFGIMFEDSVQAAYRSLTGKTRLEPVPLWAKCIGYVWTLAFLTWTTPVWTYPHFQRFKPQLDFMFPFSVAKHVIPQ